MEVCASDSETSCPPTGGGSVVPGGGSLEPCVDVCKPNEYGVAVSNLGGGVPGPTDASVGPNTPSTCYGPTGIFAFTGAHFLCCPCE